MRKLKISRILILFVVLILVVTASIYCIRTFFRQDEIIEEKSYYDLDLFSMENGWMTYKDSSYKSLTGIDVSSHNQYIDWYSVKQDEIDFAMIRVGYRGAQEGILHEDAYFNTNMQAAIQSKIKVGAYFFFLLFFFCFFFFGVFFCLDYGIVCFFFFCFRLVVA